MFRSEVTIITQWKIYFWIDELFRFILILSIFIKEVNETMKTWIIQFCLRQFVTHKIFFFVSLCGIQKKNINDNRGRSIDSYSHHISRICWFLWFPMNIFLYAWLFHYPKWLSRTEKSFRYFRTNSLDNNQNMIIY